MYCQIEKFGTSGIGRTGWSPRFWRIDNCELLQYKKTVSRVEQCADHAVKKRYNLYQTTSLLFTTSQPYELTLSFGRSNDSKNTIKLRFHANTNTNTNNDENEDENADRLQFIAWFRLLACGSQCLQNMDCAERPLASISAFAISYLLQKLYANAAGTTSTAYIFQLPKADTSDTKQFMLEVRTFYQALMVEHDKFSLASTAAALGDETAIHLWSHTLLYCLHSMPSSLLCDSHCAPLVDVAMACLADAVKALKTAASLAASPASSDEDIDALLRHPDRLLPLKRKLIELYHVTNKKAYKDQNGFSNGNRYGLMQLLFNLLNRVCNADQFGDTHMSAQDLAQCVSGPLQSKQWLFAQKSIVKNAKYAHLKNDAQYEANFVRMLKVLIHFAGELFPENKMVKWKVSTLCQMQGNEKTLVRKYNNLFSRDVKNRFYIAAVGPSKKEDADFDTHDDTFPAYIAIKPALVSAVSVGVADGKNIHQNPVEDTEEKKEPPPPSTQQQPQFAMLKPAAAVVEPVPVPANVSVTKGNRGDFDTPDGVGYPTLMPTLAPVMMNLGSKAASGSTDSESMYVTIGTTTKGADDADVENVSGQVVEVHEDKEEEDPTENEEEEEDAVVVGVNAADFGPGYVGTMPTSASAAKDALTTSDDKFKQSGYGGGRGAYGNGYGNGQAGSAGNNGYSEHVEQQYSSEQQSGTRMNCQTCLMTPIRTVYEIVASIAGLNGPPPPPQNHMHANMNGNPSMQASYQGQYQANGNGNYQNEASYYAQNEGGQQTYHTPLM